MSSDNSSWARKAAVAAVLGAGGAAALYYLMSRPGGSTAAKSKLTTADAKTLESLKALGNKLFSEKKYHEAIEIFTRAVEMVENGSEVVKAMCYQNRAASKERASGYTEDDCLADYAEALKLNPSYGKAYLRRGLLLQKQKKFREALVEIFCATQLDATLDKNAGSIMPALVEELSNARHLEFNKTLITGAKKRIRHERVYSWLSKTVVNDVLRAAVFASPKDDGSKFEEALGFLRAHEYDKVAEVAEQEEGALRPEALLLAAKFYAFANLKEHSDRCLKAFEAFFESLIEPEKDSRKDLLASKHIILLETAPSKDQILKLFYEAIASDLTNVDFYAMAAFRLVIHGEAHEAMKILSTETMDQNTSIKLLRCTLNILANTDGNLDAARLHNAILDLETFVKNLSPCTPYARSLLAKVYSTFQQTEVAQELMDEVLQNEPDQSLHYFDRSCMASGTAEAMGYLKQCLELEPYHSEANLMYASLQLNELQTMPLSTELYQEMGDMLAKAEENFDGVPDFPVLPGVFRLREVLDAKLKTAERLAK